MVCFVLSNFVFILTRGSVHALSFIGVIQRDNWETLNIVAEKPYLPEIRGMFLLFLDCTSSILSEKFP